MAQRGHVHATMVRRIHRWMGGGVFSFGALGRNTSLIFCIVAANDELRRHSEELEKIKDLMGRRCFGEKIN